MTVRCSYCNSKANDIPDIKHDRGCPVYGGNMKTSGGIGDYIDEEIKKLRKELNKEILNCSLIGIFVSFVLFLFMLYIIRNLPT